ncbi:MAG: hypothetical protein HKO65_18205 [Gemmatimonadetes bacterium]|nr:hypothetical protein [Gemmatimonadota bacterium]NNM07033.1 hypothetical protein [Gemmatimonadota bacterium]
MRALRVGFLVFVLWTPTPQNVSAQVPETPTPEEAAAAETAPLFSTHELLEITLEADFHTIRREDRERDAEERPAVIRWTEPGGTSGFQGMQIRTRGRFRLERRNCDLPPLRLNIRRSEADGTVFENQDKLKLVGVCKPNQTYWEQYVYSEYLVYRAFNLLTPLSFRVRPVQVTYVDTSGEEDTLVKFGFLIEDNSRLAARHGGWKRDWEAEMGQLDPRRLRQRHALIMEVFQYFMGNTEWSVAEVHNMELLQFPAEPPVTVPFDFDFSGMVDARYATPHPEVGGRDVRKRTFRGFCADEMGRPPELYDEVFQLFRDKEEEFRQLWQTQEGLEEGTLRKAMDYMDDFFEIISDPDRIEAYMLRDCRGLRGGG